jgi:hypothetical protein
VIRTLILFAVGATVLFFFDVTITLTLGILILFAAIVSGIFATATPEFLTRDSEDGRS